MSTEQLQHARARLQGLLARTAEVVPTEAVRILANRLTAIYPLRAADSFQLSAALVWSEQEPTGREVVILDQRLRQAAQQEGFTVLP